jgi:hypothetical protein
LTHNSDYDAFVAKVKADGTGLVYCGYIGGSGSEEASGIAVDGSGNAYVCGHTASTETTFPVQAGPVLTYNGGTDAFAAKVKADGTGLVYCGYIGGSGYDDAYGIGIDQSGSAYVCGYTDSTETTFPVQAGPDLTYNGSTQDAFVAKINADGTDLVYCGYIGGSGYDDTRGIVVEKSGSAYVCGYTDSTEITFPVQAGPDLTQNGGYDAFIAKVKADGTSLDYCGYIGGSGTDCAHGIALDELGNTYVCGWTDSPEITFPVKTGPDLTQNGDFDVFVAKIKSDGTGLVYCGYIGGNGYESSYGIAVDSLGNAYVCGHTYSTEITFPAKIGPDLTHNGSDDAFVAKVKANGTGLVYCGYIGGLDNEEARGIAVDSQGNAYVCGYTTSTEGSFPVKTGPDLTYNGGSCDAFVAKIRLKTHVPLDLLLLE